MIHNLPPGLIMMLGAFLLPLLGRKSAWGSLGLSIISLAIFWTSPTDHTATLTLFGQSLNICLLYTSPSPRDS